MHVKVDLLAYLLSVSNDRSNLMVGKHGTVLARHDEVTLKQHGCRWRVMSA